MMLQGVDPPLVLIKINFYSKPLIVFGIFNDFIVIAEQKLRDLFRFMSRFFSHWNETKPAHAVFKRVIYDRTQKLKVYNYRFTRSKVQNYIFILLNSRFASRSLM